MRKNEAQGFTCALPIHYQSKIFHLTWRDPLASHDPWLCVIALRYHVHSAISLGFTIDDMAAHDRIVFAQLKPIRIVASILRRQVHVRALCAAHLNELTRSLFRHNNTPSFSAQTSSKFTKDQYSARNEGVQIQPANVSPQVHRFEQRRIRTQAGLPCPNAPLYVVSLPPASREYTCRSARIGAG